MTWNCGFHGSIFLNHDDKGWKGKEKQKQRKYQGQTALEWVKAQKSQ